MDFSTILTWITEHPTEVSAIATAVITIAYTIAHLTPGDADDKIVSKIGRILLALVDQLPTITRVGTLRKVIGRGNLLKKDDT